MFPQGLGKPRQWAWRPLAPPIPDNLGILGLPALPNLIISPQVSGAKQVIEGAGEALYRMKGGTEPCLQSGGPTTKAP